MGMPIFAERGRKVPKKGYKFTNKKHSEKSVMSTVFGALSMISMIVLIYLSYRLRGEVPVNYGIAVMLILVFGIVGLILGVLAMQEREKFRFFAIMGLVLNGLAIVSVSAVLYAGSYL